MKSYLMNLLIEFLYIVDVRYVIYSLRLLQVLDLLLLFVKKCMNRFFYALFFLSSYSHIRGIRMIWKDPGKRRSFIYSFGLINLSFKIH